MVIFFKGRTPKRGTSAKEERNEEPQNQVQRMKNKMHAQATASIRESENERKQKTARRIKESENE